MKGVLLIFMVGLFAVWHVKRRLGRKHLRAVERGEACLSCQGTDVYREMSGVRCRTCGAFTNTAWLNESHVSTDEVSGFVPDDFDH